MKISNKVRLHAAAFFSAAPCAFLWLSTLLLLLPTIGNADVVFDLLGDSILYDQLEGQVTGSVTNGGFIATLTASEGILNRNKDGFGVNGLSGSDDVDALNQDEYLNITFYQAVYFENVNISSWNTDFDVGDVLLGSGESYISQGTILGTGDTGYGFAVNAGQSVRIKAIATENEGNGFSVDSFSIAAVPEPAVLSLVVLFGIGSLVARRWFE